VGRGKGGEVRCKRSDRCVHHHRSGARASFRGYVVDGSAGGSRCSEACSPPPAMPPGASPGRNARLAAVGSSIPRSRRATGHLLLSGRRRDDRSRGAARHGHRGRVPHRGARGGGPVPGRLLHRRADGTVLRRPGDRHDVALLEGLQFFVAFGNNAAEPPSRRTVEPPNRRTVRPRGVPDPAAVPGWRRCPRDHRAVRRLRRTTASRCTSGRSTTRWSRPCPSSGGRRHHHR
jgi:hypothetical protein